MKNSIFFLALISYFPARIHSFAPYTKFSSKRYSSCDIKVHSNKPADLSTSLESIANERSICNHIQWIDINPTVTTSKEDEETVPSKSVDRLLVETSDDIGVQRMPLCPIDSVFLSGSKEQLLNFASPQNIQMVQHLNAGRYGPPRFCAVLQAEDTKRCTNVGTILRIVGMKEFQSKEEGKGVTGVIIKVCPEEFVQVSNVEGENKHEILTDNTTNTSDDDDITYWVAEVQNFNVPNEEVVPNNNEELCTELSRKIYDDYNAVRSMYLDKDGVVIKQIPEFDIVTASWSLPDNALGPSDFSVSNERFWSGVELWQNLCYAAKKGCQQRLQVQVLEMCVEASLATFGKMKYPINRDEYSREAQDAIREFEKSEAEVYVSDIIEFVDPVLTFQAIVSAETHLQRLQILSEVISKERKRLEGMTEFA